MWCDGHPGPTIGLFTSAVIHKGLAQFGPSDVGGLRLGSSSVAVATSIVFASQ